MRATKNSKTMPHKYSNTSITKNSENKNINTLKEIKLDNSNKSNELLNQNLNQFQNNKKNEIKNIQNEKDLKKREYNNLNLISQINMKNSPEEENNNFDINNNIKEEKVNMNNKKNHIKEENISNISNNYNQSFGSNIKNENDNENSYENINKENNEDENINIGINDNIYNSNEIIKNNFNKNENIKEGLNKNENNEIVNNFHNIEIEEIEIDDYNEKYSLPLAIDLDKNKDFLLTRNNKNEEEKELNNEETKNINKNIKLLNENINNNGKDNNQNKNILLKEENYYDNQLERKNEDVEINLNENISNIGQIKKEKNKYNFDEADNDDYILNTLAKLKKKSKLKPNKEKNKILKLKNKYQKNEENKNSNNPKIKLAKSVKYINSYNNKINNIINERKKKILQYSPIIKPSTINDNNINEKDLYSSEERYTYQQILNNKLIKENSGILKIPEGVRFGIDESGNPINISQFIDDESKEMEQNKLIAFIIQNNDKNNENYLIDKKGNILEKTKDGDFLYKKGDALLVIKNLDVQNPELKNYGYRSYNSNEDNKLLNKKNIFDNKENNKYNNFYFGNNSNNLKQKHTIENESYNNFINKLKQKHNSKYINKNSKIKDIDNLILNNSNEKPFIKKQFRNNNKNNFDNSYSFKKENQDFKNLIQIWKKRYGNKNFNSINNKIKESNSKSYSVRNEDRMVERTNSILKKTSERDVSFYNISTEEENEITQINYTKKFPKMSINQNYKKPVYYNGYVNKKNEKHSFEKNIFYYYKNNNPTLKNKNIIIRKDIKNIQANRKNSLNSLYQNDLFKNNTLDLINNYDKKEGKNIIMKNNLLKNIIQKNSYSNINDEERRSAIINDNIYQNITRINNNNKNKNKKRKINMNKNYSVLSYEANKLIKEYNNKQRDKDKILKNDNKLINKTFNNNKIIFIQKNKNLKISDNNCYLNKNKLINYENLENMKSISCSKINNYINNSSKMANFEVNKNIINNIYRNNRYNS